MNICTTLPIGCTEEHLNRAVEAAVARLQIKDPKLLDIVNVKFITMGVCMICKTSYQNNIKNSLVLITMTRISDVYNSIWTPTICTDIETCDYREAVHT